jgi:transcriptional regulator with XRE-family HTH domain
MLSIAYLGRLVSSIYHSGMDTTIVTNIYRRRVELGLSQQQVAQSIGVKQATISRFESGDRTPSVGMLRLLAETLRVSIAEILGEKK